VIAGKGNPPKGKIEAAIKFIRFFRNVGPIKWPKLIDPDDQAFRQGFPPDTIEAQHEGRAKILEPYFSRGSTISKKEERVA